MRLQGKGLFSAHGFKGPSTAFPILRSCPLTCNFQPKPTPSPMPAASSSTPAPAPAPAVATPPTEAPAPAAATPPPALSAPAEPAAAGSSFLSGAQLQTSIQSMVDMGFERDQVMRALRASFNNPERAVEYLMTVRTTNFSSFHYFDVSL